jgi:UDP-N-acetyl-D-galactosamine dehydrogenase
VGGHCIGVDPYYLAHKASQLGYYPQVILSGRRVNDHIPFFIVEKVIKLMARRGLHIKNAKALILGITFKENCPDIRNSKIADIYRELCEFGLKVDVYDPIAQSDEVQREYGIHLLSELNSDEHYNAIVVAVAHEQFKNIDFKKYKKDNCVLFDVKAFVDRSLADGRL